jgi:putative transposase
MTLHHAFIEVTLFDSLTPGESARNGFEPSVQACFRWECNGLQHQQGVAENRILRSQVSSRLQLDDEQRIALATVGKPLGRAVLEKLCTIVTPETLLRWHRELVASKFDSSDRRASRSFGRPPTDPHVVELVLRMAHANPSWGYRRIVGALKDLGTHVSHQTVKNLLTEHGIDPAPRRKNTVSWADFITSHSDCLLATDFFATGVWTAFGLVTYYVLFFIHVGTRKVYVAGITRNPTDAWMRQVARNLTSAGDTLFE